MKLTALALAIAWVSSASLAPAQSNPTAERTLQLSAFAAASGVYTGLSDAYTGVSGKNFAITAGGDLGLPPWHGVRPTIEVRGIYPLDRGLVDSQKSVLAGLRVDFMLNHHFRPYADFLVGRGQINYQTSGGIDGYPFRGQLYSLTTTYIDSPGVGFEYQFADRLAIRVDAQYQRWASQTPTPSGSIDSKIGSLGLVYYFAFDHRHRR